MSQDFQRVIDDARKRSVRLELRHVGANVATAIAIMPDALGRMRPIATVDDAHAIGSILDAIVTAGPQLSKQTSEQRWHLRFVDSEGHVVLVVMSSIFKPYYGFIGDESVSFADGNLVRFLSERYAPLDVPSLRE